MARQISASVGRNAGNREADVLTVQDLLNNVPRDQGRPQPTLKLDGLCGPKTTSAIQKFQLQHFGWSGADGRVDPGGQTLAKLNALQPQQPVPPVPKQPPPPKRHTHFTLQQPGRVGDVLDDPKDFFFQVLAGSNTNASVPSSFHIDEAALFWLGRPGAVPPFLKQTAFRLGGAVPITLLRVESPGLTLSELDCPATYATREVGGGKLSSGLTLFFKPTGPTTRTGKRIKMHRHLRTAPHSNTGSGVSYLRVGQFQLVRKLKG